MMGQRKARGKRSKSKLRGSPRLREVDDRKTIRKDGRTHFQVPGLFFVSYIPEAD
jgi:hypothetical protein